MHFHNGNHVLQLELAKLQLLELCPRPWAVTLMLCLVERIGVLPCCTQPLDGMTHCPRITISFFFQMPSYDLTSTRFQILLMSSNHFVSIILFRKLIFFLIPLKHCGFAYLHITNGLTFSPNTLKHSDTVICNFTFSAPLHFSPLSKSVLFSLCQKKSYVSSILNMSFGS